MKELTARLQAKDAVIRSLDAKTKERIKNRVEQANMCIGTEKIYDGTACKEPQTQTSKLLSATSGATENLLPAHTRLSVIECPYDSSCQTTGTRRQESQGKANAEVELPQLYINLNSLLHMLN